ncbi:MAG: xylulokinase [Promethearchaeota archaeon]
MEHVERGKANDPSERRDDKLVAALDVGTTGCRTILFDLDGTERARAYAEWTSKYPKPAWVEQDAEGWWNSLKRTIGAALSKLGGHGAASRVCGVAVTNQRETIVPVDASGKPLAPAIVWQDRRTAEECAFIKEAVGEREVYETTGLTVDPYFSGSKILWFRRHRPEVYEKTAKFLLVHDYVAFKLTGRFVTDHSNASRTMLFDVRRRTWSDDVAEALDLDLDKMPEAVAPGTVVGEVTADDAGFARGTPVVAGAGDQQCAALGVGVVEPGRLKCTTGTGSFVLSYLDQPKFDATRRVLCSCHAVPDAWVNEGSIFTTGAVLRWARDVLGAEERAAAKERGVDPYEVMTELAASSPPGANGLLLVPHFMGAGCPHWNPDARGVLFGLALGHTRADVYRAVLEGVAFEVKQAVEIFSALGPPAKEVRLTGGGSRSDLWNQIMADVLAVPCLRGEVEESTAVGAAILAAHGAGEFQDVRKAAEKLARISKSWQPRLDASAKYGRLYSVARDLYRAISGAGLYASLARAID